MSKVIQTARKMKNVFWMLKSYMIIKRYSCNLTFNRYDCMACCLMLNIFPCSGARDVGGMGLGAAPSRTDGPSAPRPSVPGSSPRHRLPPIPSKVLRSVTLYLFHKLTSTNICISYSLTHHTYTSDSIRTFHKNTCISFHTFHRHI